MEVFEPSQIHQVLVKFLEGKHKMINFSSPSISVATLKRRIQTLTAIPSHLQLLVRANSRVLHDHQILILDQLPQFPKTLGYNPNPQLPQDQIFIGSSSPGLPENQLGSDGIDQTGLRKFPVVVHLLLRLRGGKGGFGSLLRGAATKAGQKKTNNFDACRDMSGRRLRHVNAEKKLEEWRAEAEERKLEKMAEEFIKKKGKEAKKSGGGDGADKYVAKYREDSARCMEEVERSVRESVMGMRSSKRKSGAEGSESDSKRLKIWLGKRTLVDSDSDSDDVDGDGSEKEEDENEKSVIIDSGNNSDSSKEAEASSGSVTGMKLDAGSIDRGSSESGSDENNCATDESLDKSLDEYSGYDKGKKSNDPVLDSIQETSDSEEVNVEVPHECDYSKEETIVSLQPAISSSKQEVASAAEVTSINMVEPVQGESVYVNNAQDLDKPLNFDDYSSAAELEVLGMERLKSELQACGLKCGGTLKERAARLFLLKATPIEMLPKKLFAKK